jgi:hypothetical protein
MKETRMRAVFGILGLAAAGFLASSVSAVGCGSDNKSTGTGGSSSGHGGGAGTQGQAGTTGNGGSNSGGSGGGGGGTATAGCQLSVPAMGDTGSAYVIADFMTTDGGAPVLPIGGTFVYGSPGPVATVTGGAWHITATTTSMASAQYWGAGIYFNGNSTGTECIDATAHTGVSFDISGTVAGTGCTVQFSINDSEHADMTAGNPPDAKAGGPAGSYAPQVQLTTISATPTPMMIPFMGAGAPANGSPGTGIDKGKLTGVQWQFTTAASGTCMVDITVDNVKFY